MRTTFQGNVWFLIERAKDLPGEWFASCPDFYVVSQGRSLKHAFDMLFEAVSMVVTSDLERGADPEDRRAPKAKWDELWGVVKHAEKRPPAEPFPSDDSEIGAFVASLNLLISVGPRSKKQSLGRQLPLAHAVYDHAARA